MRASVHVRLETHSAKNATAVLNRLGKTLQSILISLEPHRDGGMEAWLEFEVYGKDWSSIVVEVIQTAQNVGRGWCLSNAIEEEVDISSTKLSISGVNSIEIFVRRPDLLTQQIKDLSPD